jgi:CO dehydrogenase/acetyl-CoA synthase beta subunit
MLDHDRFILECRAIAEKLSREGLEVRRFQVPPETPFAVTLKGDNRCAIIGAADTAVELGHPITASFCLGLVTERKDLIAEGQVAVIGQELEELLPGRHSFALIVLAQVANPGEAATRAVMTSIYSLDLLAGCMVRIASNRIWIRISQEALDRRLTLKDMGAFLLSELKKHGFAAEIILLTGTTEQVSEIRSVAEEMAEERSIRYGEALVEKMACETGLDCDDCPETDTCRILKNAVAVKKRKRGANQGNR